MIDSAAPMRCVVVLPRGGGVERAPASLLAGLSQRRLEVVIAPNAPAAMVELARRATSAIVVVEPELLTQVGELVRAVRTYHPRVVCWRYDDQGAGRGRLSAINGTYDGPQPTDTHAPVEDEELERVLGRTRDRIGELVTRVDRPASVDEGSPLISEEELAMLLGDDDDPAWRKLEGG